jgi:anionic cell wall polymer biosynthesis LytR-Cps2A-Psr (LCP) family protein
VEINYEGFRKFIDAIGGIDTVIPYNMDYDDPTQNLHIHFNKGQKIHMDGKKAEEFVRWRKNNDGGGYARGDLGRISTQQDFLMKIIQKMKTPTGIIRVPSLLNTVTKYVKTNMDSKTMLKYMLRLRNINLSTIDRRLLAGEPKYIKNVSFFIWNRAENEEYLRNFRDELNVSSTVEEDRGNIKVSILNSTGINGLASKYKTELQNMGYDVVEIGNYSTQLENTIIKDYSLKGYGDQLNSDLKMGEVEQEKDNNTKCNIVVILGMDSVK